MFVRPASVLLVSACLIFALPSVGQRPEDRLVMPIAGAADDSAAAKSIIANVRSSDDQPLGDVRVEVRQLGTGNNVGYGYTNLHGTFEMRNLNRGRYEVVATSGLSECREEVQIDGIETAVTLRMPNLNASDGGQHTVSVAQMRVPDKAKDEWKKAREAMAKGKLEDARKRLEKALQIAPKYSDALTTRALISMDQGNLQAASDDLANAIQSDNSNAMAYLAMGALYNMKEQFDDAIRELERGSALDPTMWQAQFEMAKAELGKGAFDAALRNVNKAEQAVGNDYNPIHLVKGHILLGLKAYPDAIVEFEKYLDQEKSGPASAEARQELEAAKAFAGRASK